jgi:DNA-binding response OmpR family regulator
VTVGGEVDTSGIEARRRVCAPMRAASTDRVAVLVIDHEEVVDGLVEDFSGQPLELHAAYDPADALLLIGRTCPDVVVLGPVTGRLGPTALLEILRDYEPQLPVVVGIGPDDGALAARMAALEPAAVISHPYRREHLLRLLRSLAPLGSDIDVGPLPVDLGRLRIDGVAPEMWLDGVHSILPLREFMLLRYLAERVGRVVSRAEIAAAVWGSADTAATNTLSVHIMRLRRRFGHDGVRWITAVRGTGYQLDVPPPAEPGALA